jgi:hypothetical protein
VHFLSIKEGCLLLCMIKKKEFIITIDNAMLLITLLCLIVMSSWLRVRTITTLCLYPLSVISSPKPFNKFAILTRDLHSFVIIIIVIVFEAGALHCMRVLEGPASGVSIYKCSETLSSASQCISSNRLD